YREYVEVVNKQQIASNMSIQIHSSEATLSEDQPMLDLPLDHCRIPGQSSHPLDALPFVLTPDLTRRLASLAKRECVSLRAVYLAGYGILLSRYGNAPEVN